MQREQTGPSEDRTTARLGRRQFLGSLSAIGATGAVGAAGARPSLPSRPADHVQEWPSLEDPYYASLVEDFEGMDLPPGAFVYAQNEADTLAAYEVVGEDAQTSSIDPGDDVPFAEATRVEVTGDVTNPWDVTMKGVVEDRAVQQGDVLTVAFSHEAVESVLSWGFWAEDHWRPTAAYWGSDWSIRPHGEEFRRLVFEEGWTEESGETDGDGSYATTGFKGEYEIRATTESRSGRTTATLADGNTSVEVTVDESTPTPSGNDSTESRTTSGATGTTETGGQSGIVGYALSRSREEDD